MQPKEIEMTLSLNDLLNNEEWKNSGYKLPSYDIEEVKQKTINEPTWMHFGAGNIFRAFPAVLQQRLLDENLADTGIIVCETFDEEIIEKAYRAFDNLSLAVTLRADGKIEKELVASVVESLTPKSDYNRMEEVFVSESLQMVTLTITEKGYSIRDNNGELFPWVKNDMEAFNTRPESTIGIIARLCHERYKKGGYPLALVSLDNCSHNGTLLKEAVMEYTDTWIERGFCDSGFNDYLNNRDKISFNWSMIDKITPRPSDTVAKVLQKDGLESTEIICTSKNTYVSSFVNAEVSQYLAIEDSFPNGRPRLEDVGVLFADRTTIDKIEKMKVCTCLNPLHTVLAVFGCLLGYKSISDEMKDKNLKAFIEKVGYVEGMPVVVDPGIINAMDFIKETIEVRFPNPFVPDTPQRIASDTSKKISVRFGETLKAYIRDGKEDLSFLIFIPLFFAGWLRYLMGIDDLGNKFEISPDPNAADLIQYVEGINLGDKGSVRGKIKPLLSNSSIFGIDLYEYGLGEKVERMFLEFISGKEAVKKTIEKYLNL
jgi:fructuronate reductase